MSNDLSPREVCSITIGISGLTVRCLLRYGIGWGVGSFCQRGLRWPGAVRAAERPHDLLARRAVEDLDCDAVVGERERDVVRAATVRAAPARHVEVLGVRVRPAPAALGLDDGAPERDAPEDAPEDVRPRLVGRAQVVDAVD